MTAVKDRVNVAPKTVTEVSKKRPAKKRRKPAKRQAYEVKQVKPDPDVWKTALKVAKGNQRLLEVLTPTEIVIHNNEGWKPRR